MTTPQPPAQRTASGTPRPFSLTTYLLLVVAFSWPFQLPSLWGREPPTHDPLGLVSMVMVTVATWVAGRYVFRDGFANAGWRWGRPKHYLLVLGLAALAWVVPTVLEQVLGMHSPPAGVRIASIPLAFLLRFLVTLLPAFGEEFGWRGYMLPHLARRYTPRRTLLLHGFIWWAWHLPALVSIGMRTEGVPSGTGVAVAGTLLISLIPSVMHAVVFAYVWTATRSLAVATVYHAAFDETRDALESSIGFGPLVEPWQMSLMTVLGALLLWKGNWKQLTSK